MEAVAPLVLVTEARGDEIVQPYNRYMVVGELDPKDLRHTMIAPETRTLLKYEITDYSMVAEMFSNLMGTDTNYRKDFLEGDL